MERKKKNRSFKQIIQDILDYDVKANSYKKYFFDSLATMLASGIDIRTILVELEAESKSRYIKKMVGQMLIEVENGTPVWKVVERHDLVPEHYLSLIKIGEQSGNLPKNLESVVTQIERDRDFQNKLRSASLYPSIVGVLLLIVGFVLMTFVLPSIIGVYESLNIELPTITIVMIAVGNFLSENVAIVVPIFIVFILLLIYLLFINKPFKRMLNQVMFRMPAIGRMLQEIELSRLGFLLSSLLNSGISLIEAMRLMKAATSINAYANLYEYIAVYVEQGYTLESILSNYKNINRLLPVYPRQLLINGEKSRGLANNLLKIGDLYQKKNELTVKDLGTLFEPVLLIIVWIGVAFFAVGVIMPIYSILGNISDVSGGGDVKPVEQTVTPTPEEIRIITNLDELDNETND